MQERFEMNRTKFAAGIAGMVAGGVVGYFAFSWLLGFGMYAMLLPGALVGLGCGNLSRGYSIVLGCIAGVSALALGIFLEWTFLPFAADESLGFFLANLHQLTPITMLMIIGGAILGFVFGKGSPELAYQEHTKGS